MNFSKYFKFLGIVSFLIFGSFFIASEVSASRCLCSGNDGEAERDREWAVDEACHDDEDCVVICDNFLERADEGEWGSVSLDEESVSCESDDEEDDDDVPGEIDDVVDPDLPTGDLQGVAIGSCVCRSFPADRDSPERTIEVRGTTMEELETACNRDCRRYGRDYMLIHDGLTFVRCTHPDAQRNVDAGPDERLCVTPSATRPGAADSDDTKNAERAIPDRTCQVVNPDCMTRFQREKSAGSHIFFSDADCYCCGECTLDDFTIVFINAADYLFGILGAVALIFFIYGGLTWLTAGGSSERIEKGRKILIGAVIGIGLCVGAWFLVGLLQQALGVDARYRLN